jgi:hypothetical protein
MFSAKLKMQNGKLIYPKKMDKVAFKLFTDKLSDGQEVDIFMSISDAEGSGAQISKVHKCIRELAKESGYSFDDMKKLVKNKAGLFILNDYKSFGECDKGELSLAIQACIEIGEFYNVNLH